MDIPAPAANAHLGRFHSIVGSCQANHYCNYLITELLEVSAKGSVPEGFIHFTQPSPVRSNRKIFRPAVLVWFAQTKPAKWSSTVRYCSGVCVVSVLLFVCLPWPRASPSHGTWLALLCFALTLPSYLNCLLNSTIPSCPPLRNRL
ncbi:Adenylyl cyclase-associated protein [Fusarium oxysporum f. sp. albedinis]|nr:Adenylyl cyclase-associated protein [Fusarium oxysporum f. sp. albedinis]